MKLPKKLFVKWEGPDDDRFLIAGVDAEELAGEVGGVEEVGVYELTFTGKLATKAEFETDKLK